MEKNCIFCKIVAGEAEVEKVYEDDLIIAFLDISPINPGHIVVIPKEHTASPSSLSEEISGRIFHVASRLGLAFKKALDADGFNLHLSDGICAGQTVPHTHLHVIPRYTDDAFHWNWRKLEHKENNSVLIDKIKSKFKLCQNN
jgi:histidine triad (HIT) family protein